LSLLLRNPTEKLVQSDLCWFDDDWRSLHCGRRQTFAQN
jgi:hypothetical protein